MDTFFRGAYCQYLETCRTTVLIFLAYALSNFVSNIMTFLGFYAQLQFPLTVRLPVCLSVGLSVRHTRALYQNG